MHATNGERPKISIFKQPQKPDLKPMQIQVEDQSQGPNAYQHLYLFLTAWGHGTIITVLVDEKYALIVCAAVWHVKDKKNSLILLFLMSATHGFDAVYLSGFGLGL